MDVVGVGELLAVPVLVGTRVNSGSDEVESSPYSSLTEEDELAAGLVLGLATLVVFTTGGR
jgi:hypothetical protein